MLKKLFSLIILGVFMLSGISLCRAEGLTMELAKSKTLAAAALLEAEGDAAIAKIKDPAGEFRFAGGEGYIWIHDLDGVMIMHPIKPALDGQKVLGMTDPSGFTLFAAMNDLVTKSGQGWVAYQWPKPNEKNASPKSSFVKLIKKDGKSYVAGCGLYDITLADIKAKMSGDAVYEE